MTQPQNIPSSVSAGEQEREDPRVLVVARALSAGGFRDDDGVWHEGLTVGDMDRARAVLAALDDPTGEGAEIQGEHLREWAKAGIPLRCCFWCTLNDVTARVAALGQAPGLDPTSKSVPNTSTNLEQNQADGEGR